MDRNVINVKQNVPSVTSVRLESHEGFYSGRFLPEVQPLFLLYTIFDKSYPFHVPFIHATSSPGRFPWLWKWGPTSKATEKRPGDEVVIHGAPFTYLVWGPF